MIDWGKPTSEMLAALAMVHQQLRFRTKRTIGLYAKRYNLSDIHVAELVLTAKDLLWYRQLQGWASTTRPDLPPVWQQGAQALLALVDQCYNGTAWWQPPPTWNADTTAHNILRIADFFLLVRQVRTRSLEVVSASFEVVADLVLGIDWEKRVGRLQTALQRLISVEQDEKAGELL